MKTAYKLLTGFACALTMAAGLRGDEPSRPKDFKLGFYVAVATPVADTLKSWVGPGTSYAFFGEVPFNRNHGGRTIVEYIGFGSKYAYNEEKTSGNVFGVKEEWIYRFASHKEGPYFFAGVGQKFATANDSHGSASTLGADLSAGFGLDFGNFGLEARFTQTLYWTFDFGRGPVAYDCAFSQIGVRTRF